MCNVVIQIPWWQWVQTYVRYQALGVYGGITPTKVFLPGWFVASGNGYLEHIPPRFGEKQLLLDTASWIEEFPPLKKKADETNKICKYIHLLTSVPGSQAFPTNLSKTPSPKKRGQPHQASVLEMGEFSVSVALVTRRLDSVDWGYSLGV